MSNVLFVPRGQTISLSPGNKHFLHKHFYIKGGGPNIFASRGGQTFFVGGSGAYDHVDEEMVVSEANIFMSEASILSAGARIFRGS